MLKAGTAGTAGMAGTVGALDPRQLRAQLGGAGLYLQTGGFSTCLRSALPAVADAIGLLYADYPLQDGAAFTDFHLALRQPASLRRWLAPQVKLLCDGRSLFKPLPLAQAFPMFEWGLNWCIASRAHGYLIIHAAVVEKDGRAAILPAPPGSGKSTLCAALTGRGGWRLLSDELAMLRLADGQLQPLPRPISLKNGAIAVIRDYLPAPVFSPTVRDTVKGSVAHLKAPPDSIRRAGQGATPAWLVFPRYQAGAATRLAGVARADAFMRVATNSFNYSVLGRRGFAALADMIERTASYELAYSELDQALALFDRLPPPA